MTEFVTAWNAARGAAVLSVEREGVRNALRSEKMFDFS